MASLPTNQSRDVTAIIPIGFFRGCAEFFFRRPCLLTWRLVLMHARTKVVSLYYGDDSSWCMFAPMFCRFRCGLLVCSKAYSHQDCVSWYLYTVYCMWELICLYLFVWQCYDHCFQNDFKWQHDCMHTKIIMSFNNKNECWQWAGSSFFLKAITWMKCFIIVLNGRSSPVLFELTSVRVSHCPSCPITGRTGFCALQVQSQYGSVLFKFDPICQGIGIIL